MGNVTRFAAIGIIVFGAVLGLPLMLGIWIPDMVSPKRHVLAEERLANGDVLRIVQTWGSDKYLTEFIHVAPNGSTRRFVLKDENRKYWKASLSTNPATRTANIRFGDGRVKNVKW